jgi:hypothetical protein
MMGHRQRHGISYAMPLRLTKIAFVPTHFDQFSRCIINADHSVCGCILHLISGVGKRFPSGQSPRFRKLNSMPQKLKEHHTKAAEHHEYAAKHHRKAAEHHGAGKHEMAAHHAHVAHGHHLHAMHHASEAAKRHVEVHGNK